MHHFRATSGNPDMVTLPEHFKRSGYRTFDIGKVFNNNERTEDPQSWTELSFKGYDYYKWVGSRNGFVEFLLLLVFMSL